MQLTENKLQKRLEEDYKKKTKKNPNYGDNYNVKYLLDTIPKDLKRLIERQPVEFSSPYDPKFCENAVGFYTITCPQQKGGFTASDPPGDTTVMLCAGRDSNGDTTFFVVYVSDRERIRAYVSPADTVEGTLKKMADRCELTDRQFLLGFVYGKEED